jgi:hypothetical protein
MSLLVSLPEANHAGCTAAPPPVPGGQHMQVATDRRTRAESAFGRGTTVNRAQGRRCSCTWRSVRDRVSREALPAVRPAFTWATTRSRRLSSYARHSRRPGNPAHPTIAKRIPVGRQGGRTQNDVGAAGATAGRGFQCPRVAVDRSRLPFWWMGAMPGWSSGAVCRARPRCRLRRPDAARDASRRRTCSTCGRRPAGNTSGQSPTADLATDLSRPRDCRHWRRRRACRRHQPVPPARYLVSGRARYPRPPAAPRQLVDVDTGKQLWSERFDRSPWLFAIQEESANPRGPPRK